MSTIRHAQEDPHQQPHRPQDGLFCSTTPAPDHRSVQVCLCCAQDRPVYRLFFADDADFESRPITPDHRWVVFHSDTFAERGFTTEDEADSWLRQVPTWPLRMLYSNVTNADQLWRGPVPIVGKCSETNTPFAGPWLRDAGVPATFDGDELLRAELRDCLGDEGYIPVLEAAQTLGYSFPLNPTQFSEVLKRAALSSITAVRCRLADNWGFSSVLGAGWNLPYHSGTVKARNLLEHLYHAVLELEISLFNVQPDISIADMHAMLTSVQFHGHIKRLANRYMRRYEANSVAIAVATIERWIGSYAATLRLQTTSTGPACADAAHTVRGKAPKKRGRPTKFPVELKRKALSVKGGRARAQILYGVKFPTPQQIKNVPSILRHFLRTHQEV